MEEALTAITAQIMKHPHHPGCAWAVSLDLFKGGITMGV
jgi:hypothetical protein